MNYYDWMNTQKECLDCDWQGLGKDAETGEVFRDGTEYHCPKCGRYFGFIAFPTVGECLSDQRAGEHDQKAAAVVLRRQREFDQVKLKSPDQLPDLPQPIGVLVWHVDDEDAVILYGQQEIWREPSWFENFRRFGVIAGILQQKYGKALCDLVPTRDSFLDLYGDDLGSISFVERVRKALDHGNEPPAPTR